MSKTKTLKRPTARNFFDPLVKVLGIVTHYSPHTGVYYREVLDLVLEEYGIDPKDSPWPLEGAGGKAGLGLYRVISYAFRNQREGYSGSREPTCFLLDANKGLWALTEIGVQRAREMCGLDPIASEIKDENEFLKGVEDIPSTSRDERDDISWVAIELTYIGEAKVEEGTLEKSLRKDLGVTDTHPVFIPSTRYTRKGRSMTLHLMEGYAFVGSGLEEVAYFRLESKPYVNKVMSVRNGPYGMRGLSVIPDSYVRKMRVQLRELKSSNISENDPIKVVEGLYNALEGTVVDTEGEYATVLLPMRSRKIITRLPKVYLEIVEEG